MTADPCRPLGAPPRLESAPAPSPRGSTPGRAYAVLLAGITALAACSGSSSSAPAVSVGDGDPIALRSPAAGARDVEPTATVRLEFALPMAATSLHSGSFRVTDFRGEAVLGRTRANARSLEFVPDTAWGAGQAYRVTLSAAARAASGENLDRDWAWSFAVRDDREWTNPVPVVTSQSSLVYEMTRSDSGETIVVWSDSLGTRIARAGRYEDLFGLPSAFPLPFPGARLSRVFASAGANVVVLAVRPGVSEGLSSVLVERGGHSVSLGELLNVTGLFQSYSFTRHGSGAAVATQVFESSGSAPSFVGASVFDPEFAAWRSVGLPGAGSGQPELAASAVTSTRRLLRFWWETGTGEQVGRVSVGVSELEFGVEFEVARAPLVFETRLAPSDDDSVFVAWRGRSAAGEPGKTEIWAARYAAGDPRMALENVAAGVGVDRCWLAGGGGGNGILAWRVGGEIFSRRWDTTLGSWGPTQSVIRAEQSVDVHAFEMDRFGRTSLVWSIPTDADLRVSRHLDGVGWMTEEPIAGSAVGKVAIDDLGNISIAATPGGSLSVWRYQ